MTCLSRSLFIVLTAAVMFLTALTAAAQKVYQPERDSTPTGTKFERYFTQDKFGRKITFYLSLTKDNSPKLPLIVFIKRGELVYGGLQNLVLQKAQDRARVLIVEKPGVKFLDSNDQPGAAEKCSPEFLAEHTLDRWGEAVGASLKAAWQLPGVDPSKTLVAGHSEGGIVAARVAAENPQVTHVASLAGGGPTQLFDLAEIARQRSKPATGNSLGAADAGQWVYENWKQIQADMNSTTKFFWGHPYRRWSSFLKTSVLAELLQAKAKIYLAQGTLDQTVTVTGFDMLRAELVSRGRDVTVERIEGADHGFTRGPEDMEGIRRVFANVVNWFLSAEEKD
jgi:dienelactone hydrolase